LSSLTTRLPRPRSTLYPYTTLFRSPAGSSPAWSVSRCPVSTGRYRRRSAGFRPAWRRSHPPAADAPFRACSVGMVNGDASRLGHLSPRLLWLPAAKHLLREGSRGFPPPPPFGTHLQLGLRPPQPSIA